MAFNSVSVTTIVKCFQKGNKFGAREMAVLAKCLLIKHKFEPRNPHFKKPDNVECACIPSCEEKEPEGSRQLAGQTVYLNWQTPEPCHIKKVERDPGGQLKSASDIHTYKLTHIQAHTCASSHTWIHTTSKQINQELFTKCVMLILAGSKQYRAGVLAWVSGSVVNSGKKKKKWKEKQP